MSELFNFPDLGPGSDFMPDEDYSDGHLVPELPPPELPSLSPSIAKIKESDQ